MKQRFIYVAPLLGIGVMLGILAAMNSQLLYSQLKYWVTPATVSAAPSEIALSIPSDGPPRIIVPKINVDAPLVMGMNEVDEKHVQNALQNGVLHFGGSPEPGQGNSVFVGHSSNSVWDTGDYKFVFALLDRLEKGDSFYIVNKSVRYEYRVSDEKVVPPSDISVVAASSKPVATLVTCTPVGTSWNRLVIVGEQVSPAPSASVASTTSGSITSLPRD